MDMQNRLPSTSIQEKANRYPDLSQHNLVRPADIAEEGRSADASLMFHSCAVLPVGLQAYQWPTLRWSDAKKNQLCAATEIKALEATRPQWPQP
jgi:hypothetical protein